MVTKIGTLLDLVDTAWQNLQTPSGHNFAQADLYDELRAKDRAPQEFKNTIKEYTYLKLVQELAPGKFDVGSNLSKDFITQLAIRMEKDGWVDMKVDPDAANKLAKRIIKKIDDVIQSHTREKQNTI